MSVFCTYVDKWAFWIKKKQNKNQLWALPSSKLQAQNYQFDSVRSEGETHLLLNIMEDVDTFLDMQKYCDTDFIEKASRASKGVRS